MGIFVISSAVDSYSGSIKFIVVQSCAVILGFLAIFFIVRTGYGHIASFEIPIFIACAALLILVLIPGIGTGFEEKGGRSWFRFGSFGFQPSEIVKVGFIVTMAKHFSLVESGINKLPKLAGILMHAGAYILLVMLEPDAGTAMVFMFILLVMLFFSGISYKYIGMAAGALAALAPIAWKFALKDYQKDRITNFLHPEKDPLASGYQVVQSKMAAGSGRIFGKGFLKGTSTQFGFLPEKHTDFIYSVVCEEFGLIGGLAVIIVLTVIILRCIIISRRSKDSLGTYITLGAAAMLIFQMFENVGMCIGLMPVTGITLPFISYGGSSLLSNLAALGLVLSVGADGG
jgi:rod shape determining protein RodA